ncbi:uncharacterized protein B0P05DRAFT_573053 [Gilbertella persicaria]|uniref:uncharacterized protein n=1 Tax=Gilbertella persicaria TaxID=101096 RepID=UPI00221F8B73|nr:uncharacterized protein B0P05DRAFT_573053 [Gilbertella persicaria]KAI8073520.1 hypothetical protein B0P05DRAFT_573053 [Gilbertella persicaria]
MGLSHNLNTLFFYEDGTGGIFDEQGQEAPSYVEDKSFRLKKLTDLRKYIKSQEVQVEMKEAEPKKERDLQHNVYTFEDRKYYFYFLKERLMKPKQAAIAANVNYHTACKWKQTYEDDPERSISVKKTNKTIYRIASQLNEAHKSHLINFLTRT